jgi:CubicO group peptidase (beta-lactamase class C family)
MRIAPRLFFTPAVAGALIVLSSCGGSDAAPVPGGPVAVRQAAQKLDTLVPDWMARTGVPGVAVSVVYRGQVVYAKGFGVRCVGSSATVDADTVFQLASVSKSMGSTVMTTQMPGGAGAAGQPVIDWNTPINSLIPESEFELNYPDPATEAKLTLGDLYGHRSGLPDHAGDQLEDIGYTRAYILQHLRDVPLNAYGTYDYTNYGLTAAAQAMAQARGTDWATLSQNALYGPLGMASTSSRYDDFAQRGDRACGHVQTNISYDTYGEMPAQYQVQTPQRNPDQQSPAGGVSSSVNDMARWMELVLAGGKWQDKQLLSSAGLQAAMTAHPDGKYGYGFNVSTDPMSHASVSHSGAFMMGAATSFILWPEDDLGITVLTNAQPRGLPEAIAVAFGEAALGDAPGHAPGTDWLEFMQSLPTFHDMYQPLIKLLGQVQPASPAAPSQQPTSYVGNYTNDYYGTAQIALDADGQSLDLVMGPAGNVRYHLASWGGNIFVFGLQDENAPAGSMSAVQFTFQGAQPQSMRIGYYSQDSTGGLFTRVP